MRLVLLQSLVNGDAKKNRKKRRKHRHDDILDDLEIDDDGKFLYEEAKYSATSILSQLGRTIQNKVAFPVQLTLTGMQVFLL